MHIKSIQLLGFRNYFEAKLDFEKSKLIIIGKNAQGKSNLLETIQILSHIKSRRAGRDAELVNFDFKEAAVHARVLDAQNEEKEIALLIRKSGRRTLKINEVKKKPEELAHNIYSVSFMVDDLEIINGAPADRRKWLDSVLLQLDREYKTDYAKFENILSQRNSYIKELNEKNIFHPSQLSQSQQDQFMIWDEMYIKAANKITEKRIEFTDLMNPLAKKSYFDISKVSKELSLNYKGSRLDLEALEESRAKDFARSYTNLGPQRDDIDFLLDEKLAKAYASQGERRTTTLAIKLAELELLKNQYGEYPILLLDDVLAELDESRQDYLLDAINQDTQVIITTTHLGSHLEKWSDNAQIVEIDDGRIILNNLSPEEKAAAPF